MKKLLIVSALIILASSAYGAEQNVCTNREFTNAIKKGNIEFVKENVSNLKDINDASCFLCTAVEKKQDKVLDVLLEAKADPDCPNCMVSPLYTALVYKNNYAVEKLLSAGANPNNTQNLSLIYLAVATDNIFATEKLLEAGADENSTFFKISAVKLAFYTGSLEMQEAFIDYWNKRFKTPATDINAALNALATLKSGNKYYQILTGNNPEQKPFKIYFCDLTKINPDLEEGQISYVNVYNSELKQNIIYIDNAYRNIPVEILATILASESINTDGKMSVIEQLTSYGVMAQVWQEFTALNPKLTDESTTFVKGLNGMVNILNMDNARYSKGDYNNFWTLSGLANKRKMTSKGFRNKDLNTYFLTEKK